MNGDIPLHTIARMEGIFFKSLLVGVSCLTTVQSIKHVCQLL